MANGFFMPPLRVFSVAAGVSQRTNLCRLTAAATCMEGRLPCRPVNHVAAIVRWRTFFQSRRDDLFAETASEENTNLSRAVCFRSLLVNERKYQPAYAGCYEFG
jgi:hypothetical protein